MSYIRIWGLYTSECHILHPTVSSLRLWRCIVVMYYNGLYVIGKNNMLKGMKEKTFNTAEKCIDFINSVASTICNIKPKIQSNEPTSAYRFSPYVTYTLFHPFNFIVPGLLNSCENCLCAGYKEMWTRRAIPSNAFINYNKLL